MTYAVHIRAELRAELSKLVGDNYAIGKRRGARLARVDRLTRYAVRAPHHPGTPRILPGPCFHEIQIDLRSHK